MQKIVVISSNNNVDYLHYAKYQERSWNTLGWQLCIMITHDVDPKDLELPSYFQPSDKLSTIIIKLPEIEGLRTATIAQSGRLYAANELPEDALIMTCDMDLIPLSDYWKPELFDITCYGHDLTDYSYLPMGYCAMSGKNWKKYMNLTGLTKEDMIHDSKDPSLSNDPYSTDWNIFWGFDWDLLTKRLMPYKSIIKFINRGRREDGSGFAHGRIDRGDSLKVIPKPWTDLHGENNNVKHPDKQSKFLAIFNEVYGKL